jgi:predicted cupin superfamily sugar epimerase
MITPSRLIKQYSLQPHPEGGWYRQTYKSNGLIPAESLSPTFNGSRPFSTAIYFLLEQENFSAFHRIKSDECWHFYAGDALLIYVIQQDGAMKITTLGNDIDAGHLFQYVVPANYWFASVPAPGSVFSFVGCTVSPGFDFADFELADTIVLSKQYPQHEKLIKKLCR